MQRKKKKTVPEFSEARVYVSEYDTNYSLSHLIIRKIDSWYADKMMSDTSNDKYDIRII